MNDDVDDLDTEAERDDADVDATDEVSEHIDTSDTEEDVCFDGNSTMSWQNRLYLSSSCSCCC